MRVSMIEEMMSVFSSPTYVFHKSGQTVMVDKVEIDGKKVVRKRYVLTAGQQCTCLGFLKFQNCKHLRMWRGEKVPIDCKGVPALVAVDEVKKLMDLLTTKKIVAETFDHAGNELPELVTQVKVKVYKKGLGLSKLVCWKVVEEGAFELVLDVSEEEKPFGNLPAQTEIPLTQ